jgi:hypothetical protein
MQAEIRKQGATMKSYQFSLGALMAVVTLVCVGLGMARVIPVPNLSDIDPLIWWGFAMVGFVGLSSAAGVRWLNS